MKKLLRNITYISLILLLTTGCGKTAKLKDGDTALVSFENQELNISVNDLYNTLKEKYGANHMIEMIDKKILDLEYPTDEVANKYLANQIEMMQNSYGGEKKFIETLQNYGYEGIEDFKKTLLLSYKRELALKDYVKDNLSDSEIEKYYKNNVFGDITASHILITVDTNNTMTDEEKREAEEKANKTIDEIYTKLEEGTDFHELAKEYSKDTATASDGGKLGTFNYGEMEKDFEKAAKSLKVGKYTPKAVKTSYGYHIIYKENEKEKPALNTVKQTIIDDIVKEKINNDSKLQYKALIELRKSYGIKINDEDLNSQYDTAINNWLYSKDEN